uniref:G_PROTEIN_RECEP_F1_2 domain-containing protein n=1 Tax=Steinernema glaseri TaxID=37863 RepID=A0A1I7Y5H1_9BILA
MALITPYVFFIVSAACSTGALLLNLGFIFVYFKQKPKEKTHFAILLFAVIVHTLYDLSCALYNGYILTSLHSGTWNTTIVFWSGNVAFSFMLTIIVCNCCITIDRIVAMRSMVLYNLKYAKYCRVLCVILIATSFFMSFFYDYIGLLSTPSATPPTFNTMVYPHVLSELSLARTLCCIVNVGLTVVFVIETRSFLNRPTSQTTRNLVKKINQVVLSQIAMESLILVLPDLITQACDWFFYVNLRQVIGSYPIALCSFYTICSSVLLTHKLWKSRRPQRNQTLQISSTL